MTTEKIQERLIEQEMKQSFLDYAMAVIVSRALPDVRDGLKPVHRRILYSMYESGFLSSKPFKKSARIVGDVLGRYHPHGDAAVYQTMVRMAQDFSLRYTLIQGQGNWGSVDGDSAAAMRYTEARMNKFAEKLLEDIHKETVEFQDNFDASLKEPTVLPCAVPNLLVNGSSGIAVGMATNIPPHNLNEICEGVKAYIDNPEIEVEQLMQYVKGPDFPTSGIIIDNGGLLKAYTTGRGKILVRAKYHFEEKPNKDVIIIDEIPYQTNKANLIEEIAELVKNKVIEEISDLRDESDRDGMRVVIELKRDANKELVVNKLLKHSRLQQTYSLNLLALVKNKPRTLSLKEIVKEFFLHREIVVTKRTEFDLRKAEERAHILVGLIIALNNIDKAIELIKTSPNNTEAKDRLVSNFELDEIQAQAILDMKLQRLTGLEQDKLRSEHNSLQEEIKKLRFILSDINEIHKIIKQELDDIENNFGDPRKTVIEQGDFEDIDNEDLIKKEDQIITISHEGYIKRQPIDAYRMQNRGGKGVTGAKTKEDDFLEHIFIGNTHDYILFFTNFGTVHWLKVYKIPEGSRISKGKPVINLLSLNKEDGEKITAYIPIQEFREDQYLVMATECGIIKKTTLSAFKNPRVTGIKAITLDESDKLINVILTNGSEKLLIASRDGQAVRFNETDVRPTGRSAMGVRGIKLKGKDKVIGMIKAEDTDTILTVTAKGYGKRTQADDYRIINRGGSGVINLKISEKNGQVIDVRSVKDDDQIILISHGGIIIRMATKDISVIGRNTQGVRLMRLDENDQVISTAKITPDDEEEEE
ncbi:DNA gyrase subunit A [Candidatus Woesearchaeota archaeon]|nr:DNA gyrase subunit A [Candidatus Woesearchaeota archaeon]